MLTTAVKIADLVFYLVVVHAPLYDEYGQKLYKYIYLRFHSLHGSRENKLSKIYEGYARAHKALHRQ